jgi:hypothetical protein
VAKNLLATFFTASHTWLSLVVAILGMNEPSMLFFQIKALLMIMHYAAVKTS